MRPAIAAIVLALLTPAAALASGSGGTTAPSTGTPAAETPAPSGGTRPGDAVRVPRDRGRRRPAPRPRLVTFAASASKFYELGRPARVVLRIDGRARTVAVKLHVLRRGRLVRTIDLGARATGRRHTVPLTARLPEGALQLRIAARDARGRGLRASTRTDATESISFYRHRFPVLGPVGYGSDGARFGAGRPGHVHQGQDLTAASGTPVVAPRGGVVETVAYQAGGAGNYIVLRGAGENRTYVFMHLLDGSTRVRKGDRVRTGERLAQVGSTGSSSGPHLHFEIWKGAWFGGGTAIDPLPDLRRWDSWS